MPPEPSADRDLEDHVVSVVTHNTGGPQPDRVPWHVVLSSLTSYSKYDVDAVWDALDAAVEADRLGYDEDDQ